MKVGVSFNAPQSSFWSMEKDFALVIDKILHNKNLVKLLYYTEPNCQKMPDLNQQQLLSLINKQIRIVPVLPIVKECPTSVIITFDSFTPNAKNPQFRDCHLNFDILCHPDHWNLGDFQLRPYKIAGEIDAMINGQKLTGIGESWLIRASDLVLNNQHMGLSLEYRCIHGVEDILPVDE